MEIESAGFSSSQSSDEASRTLPENTTRKIKKGRRYELPVMPPGLIWRRPKVESPEKEVGPTAGNVAPETPPPFTGRSPRLAEPLDRLPPARHAEQSAATKSDVPHAAGWVEDFARMPATDEVLAQLPQFPDGFHASRRFWEDQEISHPGEREPGTLPSPIVSGEAQRSAASPSGEPLPEKVKPQTPAAAQEQSTKSQEVVAEQPEDSSRAEAERQQPATEMPAEVRGPEDETNFVRLAAAERATAETRKVKAYLLHERGRLVEQLTPQAVEYVEWLGGAIVAAEQMAGESEPVVKTPEERPAQNQNSMDRSELLALAGSIRIDGVSVKEMFSARRIDEQGLRRIVVEFLRGRDVRKILTQEIIREQLKFERDPQLRHPRRFAAGGGKAATKAVGAVAGRAKKIADPQRAKHHAKRLGANLMDGFDEAKEVIDAHPQIFKAGGGIAAVVIYTTILILLIKS